MRTSRRFLLASGLAAASLGALGGCSEVAIFDTLVPKDSGAVLVKAGIPYGPDAMNRLDVYVPDPMPARAPVVMFIYGGSWDSGSRSDYAFVGKAFAARGFVTVIPDTRLVPQVRFPGFIDDDAHALRWVRDHVAAFHGDPGRIYVVGHSSGAYNTVMLALDPRFLRDVGLPRGTIKKVAALSGPYDFLPLDVDATKAAFGQVKDLASTQPIKFVSASAPPMLLATGSADTLVYPRNTVTLATKLRQAGAKVTEKIYPGIGHAGMVVALARPFRGRAPVLADVVAFFAK